MTYRFRGQPCFYCGNEAEGYDHKVARSKGGDDTAKNLVPACLRCNARKGPHSIEEFRLRLMIADRTGPVRFYGEEKEQPKRDFLWVYSKNCRGKIMERSIAHFRGQDV